MTDWMLPPAWMPLSVAVWIVQMIAYHGFGLGFELMDQKGWLARYKVRPADQKTYLDVLPRVLFNQVFILLPSMMALEYIGLAFTGAPQLAWWHFLLALPVMSLGHDLVQYLSHRVILHRPSLMNVLGHSVHHSTNASRSISACYMSPADFFLEIVLPYLVPLMVVGGGGSDVLFHYFIVASGAFGGLYEHSGYDFAVHQRRKLEEGAGGLWARIVAGQFSSHAHGEHHRRGMVSFSDGFGSTSLCDTVLKTRWDLVPERQRQTNRTREAEH